MIFAVGVDLVSVARIAEAMARQGERFTNKVLSESERRELAAMKVEPQARFVAKRWAAKEAMGKACRTGIRTPLTLASITLTHDALGAPALTLDPAVREHLALSGIAAWHVSLSDEGDQIIATVIAESKD